MDDFVGVADLRFYLKRILAARYYLLDGVTARPFMPKEALTFAVPVNKFLRMAANMDESFLITGSWERVKKRMGND